MKQIAIIAACLIAHSIPSFAAQHVPGLQTCIGTPELRHWFEQMQCKKLKADQQKNKTDRQKNIEYYNQFPKLSSDELNEMHQRAAKEAEKNKAKWEQQQKDREREWYRECKDSHSDGHYRHLKYATETLLNDHRKRYQPNIKTITCYPPQLLLEWKKSLFFYS